MNEANTMADILGEAEPTAFPADPKCPRPHIAPPTTAAFDLLKKAIKLDSDYAWSWQCNIAMPILDSRAGVSHEGANEAAAAVMQHLFGVDVRSSRHWMSTFNSGGFAQNGEG